MLAEIEDDLDGGDLELVTKKLSAIQSSLKILTHAPDYEERVLHVEGLKNRLEAMSSPHLVQAFNNNDLAKARGYQCAAAFYGFGSGISLPCNQVSHRSLLEKSFRKATVARIRFA